MRLTTDLVRDYNVTRDDRHIGIRMINGYCGLRIKVKCVSTLRNSWVGTFVSSSRLLLSPATLIHSPLANQGNWQ